MSSQRTFPSGNLERNSGVLFVSPNTNSGGSLTTLIAAPLYWAAINTLAALKLSGYVYSVCGQWMGTHQHTLWCSKSHEIKGKINVKYQSFCSVNTDLYSSKAEDSQQWMQTDKSVTYPSHFLTSSALQMIMHTLPRAVILCSYTNHICMLRHKYFKIWRPFPSAWSGVVIYLSLSLCLYSIQEKSFSPSLTVRVLLISKVAHSFKDKIWHSSLLLEVRVI